MNRQEIAKKIVLANDKNNQLFKATEECAELIQAINKHRMLDSFESLENLIEEMADVTIMIEELKAMYEITDSELNGMIDTKLRRTTALFGLAFNDK